MPVGAVSRLALDHLRVKPGVLGGAVHGDTHTVVAAGAVQVELVSPMTKAPPLRDEGSDDLAYLLLELPSHVGPGQPLVVTHRSHPAPRCLSRGYRPGTRPAFVVGEDVAGRSWLRCRS